ncbi:MAG: RluA family pseudouridine synthase [Bacillales bacterium]|nr:RluA family pseudouridine synthase [Bacillales bacterium]
MKQVTINKNQEGQTIYKFVKKYLKDAPISFIEKLFRIKDVKVNGVRVNKNYVIFDQDVVQLYVTDAQLEEFNKPRQIEKMKNKPAIIYEDENILICNKPSGLLVHGDEKEKRITLTNIVNSYLYEKNEFDPAMNEGFIPGPAHRIDRNTSGLVIFGKNIKALQSLEELFKERDNIEKHYLALVCGRLTEEGTINKPLCKDEKQGKVYIRSLEKGGKTAITKYSIEEIFKDTTLVKAELITGRTHQIRVHFASINHPLVGDSKYGDFQKNKEFKQRFNYEGQFLHAHEFRFKKIDGFLSYLSNKVFFAPLGEKEKNIIQDLKKD